MFSGYNGDGTLLGTFDVGDIRLPSFGNDLTNSISVDARYGSNCKVRLHAAIPESPWNGQDWKEYIVNNGENKIINYLTQVDDEYNDPNTEYTVWTSEYSQVSWMVIEMQD